MSIAAIFAANFSPSVAPFPRDSKTFPSVGSFKLDDKFISLDAVLSVSGYIIFATTSAAGALIIDAAIRCPAIPGIFSSIPTYIAITPPATVANPPVIIAINSEFVILAINGFITRGASVCPTNILAEILVVSGPLVFIVFCITIATILIIFCIIPIW